VDLLHIDYFRVVLTHLGYLLYLLYTIGVPRISCAMALLASRFPNLKEWAYTGAFFQLRGSGGLTSARRRSRSLLAGTSHPFRVYIGIVGAAFALAPARPSCTGRRTKCAGMVGSVTHRCGDAFGCVPHTAQRCSAAVSRGSPYLFMKDRVLIRKG
jgi:hypothetical protein